MATLRTNVHRRIWRIFIAGLVIFGFVVLVFIFMLADQHLSTTRDSSSEKHMEPSGERPPQYWIRTEGCNILNFEPTHPSIVAFANEPIPELVCSMKPPLTVGYGTTLTFHKEILGAYAVSPGSRLNCSYQAIQRVAQDPDDYDDNCDNIFVRLHKIPLLQRETAIEDDGIFVTCDDENSKTNNPVYQNVHHFVQPERAAKKRQRFKDEVEELGKRPEKLSVMIMGTDSVSRGNLYRSMPKTLSYLTKNLKAFEFMGYNKVGDNTYPNMVPFLTGMSTDELRQHKCQEGRNHSKFDDCPIVWKDFAKQNYVTAYAEDTPGYWIFQVPKPGFVEEPTDYYDMAPWLASNNYIGHNASVPELIYVCQGPSTSMSVIHNYSLAIAEELRDIPSFTFFFTTTMTHELLNAAKYADEYSFQYLKRLHEGGTLEDTIFFFMSDHGMRYGTFRETYEGMMEDRLPFMFIRFPEWFKEKYPEAMKAIQINTRRLTTPFDIHATLLDILKRGYTSLPQRITKAPGGQSLFQKLPSTRTCEDAGIPDHFCGCENSDAVHRLDPGLYRAAVKTVEELNKNLQSFPQCVQLTFDAVQQGRISHPKKNTSPGDDISTTYTVVFTTKPGGAKLEATVRLYENQYELTSEVSRINKYGNQNHCIDDSVLRKYCYCLDLLKT